MALAASLNEYQLLLGDPKCLEIGRLHTEFNEDSGEEELVYMPASPEEGPLFRCLRDVLEKRLAEAIAALPEQEQLVMSLFYCEKMTMHQIGLTLGVVESRVLQVHASAAAQLRTALKDLAASGAFENSTNGKRPNGGGAASIIAVGRDYP
jgi:RNA polymerase sigma factor for flagellar operon FliA